MRRVLLRALILVIGSATLGLLANTISPCRIPFIAPPPSPPSAKDIVTLADVKAAWQSGTSVILDARNPEDYAKGHIPTAFNLPVEEFETFFPRVAPMLTTDMTLIVYCDGEQCDLSHELQKRLRGLGFKNVRVLINGWTVWQEAHLPGNTGENP
jgi:rhodanese-related sulfurtransferase